MHINIHFAFLGLNQNGIYNILWHNVKRREGKLDFI